MVFPAQGEHWEHLTGLANHCSQNGNSKILKWQITAQNP